MDRRSNFDVPAANECPDCKGRGYPPHTAQIVRNVDGRPQTTELGYGCTICLGTGRLAPEAGFGVGRLVEEQYA